ncbi:MAG: hypothetical protein ACXVHS_05565 [Methanobacterium sp.]
MVEITWQEIEEFQEQLKKIIDKSPDKDLRFIDFLCSEESMESMKLFYKVYFAKHRKPLITECWIELKVNLKQSIRLHPSN